MAQPCNPYSTMNRKKTLILLLGALLLMACKSRTVNVQPALCDTSAAVNQVLEELKDWRSILADIRVRFTELLNAF